MVTVSSGRQTDREENGEERGISSMWVKWRDSDDYIQWKVDRQRGKWRGKRNLQVNTFSSMAGGKPASLGDRSPKQSVCDPYE